LWENLGGFCNHYNR